MFRTTSHPQLLEAVAHCGDRGAVAQVTDETLVGRARQGERQAAAELYRRHADTVYRRLGRLVGPVPEREDLLQQVFSEVLSSLHRFRGEARFSSYLFRVTTNIAYDHLRRRSSPPRFLPALWLEGHADGGPSPEAATITANELELVWRCLERIKPKKRIALLLRLADGLSIEEIALQVGARPETVAKRIQHAHRELLRMLARRHGGDAA